MNIEERIKIIKAIKVDPVWGIEKAFNCKYGLWEKQKEIVRAVLADKEKIVAVRSCHDSGKSFIAARIGLIYLLTNADSLVVTTAPGWTQVKEILWREIGSAYGEMGSFQDVFGINADMGTTKLNISNDWFAIGLATKKEGEAIEVAERMLGFHSKTGKILVIVDEGSGVMEPVWGAIDGLLTSDKAQLLTIGNPYRKTGSFAKLFTQRGVRKIHITDTDTPNIKENKVIIPGLMSPVYPQEMADKYGIDSNIYRIKVKGEFPTAETDTLIPVDDIEKAFARNISSDDKKVLGVDVARYGDAFTVLVVRQGKKVLRKEKHGKESTMETVGRVMRMMEDEDIKAKDVNIDDIGVGGGVVDRLQEKGYGVNGVNVGMVADDDDHFKNIRAEIYWSIKSWIKGSDLPEGDEDFYQLSNIKYKWSSEKKGQLKIESKDDMRKRGLESPDTADALALTFASSVFSPFPEQPSKNESRTITGGLLNKQF